MHYGVYITQNVPFTKKELAGAYVGELIELKKGESLPSGEYLAAISPTKLIDAEHERYDDGYNISLNPTERSRRPTPPNIFRNMNGHNTKDQAHFIIEHDPEGSDNLLIYTRRALLKDEEALIFYDPETFPLHKHTQQTIRPHIPLNTYNLVNITVNDSKLNSKSSYYYIKNYTNLATTRSNSSVVKKTYLRLKKTRMVGRIK
jgi:hypothetical protein